MLMDTHTNHDSNPVLYTLHLTEKVAGRKPCDYGQ